MHRRRRWLGGGFHSEALLLMTRQSKPGGWPIVHPAENLAAQLFSTTVAAHQASRHMSVERLLFLREPAMM